MSNMTDLWLSGVFFQALNTPKLVFGRGSLRRSPRPYRLGSLRRLDLGACGASVVSPQHKFLATPMRHWARLLLGWVGKPSGYVISHLRLLILCLSQDISLSLVVSGPGHLICCTALFNCRPCDNCCYLGHTKNPDDDDDDDW